MPTSWLPATIISLLAMLGFFDSHSGWPIFKAALSMVDGGVVRLAWQGHWLAPCYLYARVSWVLWHGLKRGQLIGTSAASMVFLVGLQEATAIHDTLIGATLRAFSLDNMDPLNIKNWLAVTFALGVPMAINEALLALMVAMRDGDKGIAR